MKINGVFPNPTVKKVIFQIRFPNLFFIKDRIGDYQMNIMEKFPNSELLLKTQFTIGEISAPEDRIDNYLKNYKEKFPGESPSVVQSWQFKSENNVILNVSNDSLSLSSTAHKTYDKIKDNSFRDIISYAIDNFLKITNIPILLRIGLRYIDQCPLPNDSKKFKSYYNSIFPFSRFKIEETENINFRILVKRKDFFLRYLEKNVIIDNEPFLILDYDAYAERIKSNNYINVSDKLHKIISDEYKKTIKEPIYEIMRSERKD